MTHDRRVAYASAGLEFNSADAEPFPLFTEAPFRTVRCASVRLGERVWTTRASARTSCVGVGVYMCEKEFLHVFEEYARTSSRRIISWVYERIGSCFLQHYSW